MTREQANRDMLIGAFWFVVGLLILAGVYVTRFS
jgi:hypothetical protein